VASFLPRKLLARISHTRNQNGRADAWFLPVASGVRAKRKRQRAAALAGVRSRHPCLEIDGVGVDFDGVSVDFDGVSVKIDGVSVKIDGVSVDFDGGVRQFRRGVRQNRRTDRRNRR
jgi:hypothetical protein